MLQTFALEFMCLIYPPDNLVSEKIILLTMFEVQNHAPVVEVKAVEDLLVGSNYKLESQHKGLVLFYSNLAQFVGQSIGIDFSLDIFCKSFRHVCRFTSVRALEGKESDSSRPCSGF